MNHLKAVSEPSTFLLVNRYIICNKFNKHVQLRMIMIYNGALGPRSDINNGSGVSPGSLASKNQSVAWYACEAPFGKER